MRTIHLNPLRAGLVDTLRRLNRYKCSGHSALPGIRKTVGKIGNMFSNGLVHAKGLHEKPILNLSKKALIKAGGRSWWGEG